MLPEGWKLTTLGKVCEGKLQTGPFGSQLHAYEYQETGVSVMMPKDIRNCRANISKAAKISPQRADDLSKHKLFTGDLLFSRRGDVTRFALIEEETAGNLCGTGCLRARPSKNHSPVFLSYILQKNTVKTWLEQNAVGQTMPNMNTAILNELPLISASSREEEDKIATILSTWDKAIGNLEALIAAKQKRKKALMQQLLTGKKRFSGFDGDWKLVAIGAMIKESRVPSKSNDPEKRLTVRLNFKGIEHRQFRGTEAIDSTSHFVRKVGQFIYGKQNFHKGAFGIIPKRFDCYETSQDIPSFDFSKICNSQWFFYFCSQDWFYKGIENLMTGTGSKRLNPKVFQNLKFPFPNIQEQQKIATVLSAADHEITLNKNQLAALKQQKTALMQQLLTGKKRVQINED
jgi:type I restriction enzyme S subunit